MIYLDNNATTIVAPEVKEAMEPYLSTIYGNPSSVYEFGKRVRRSVEEARAIVARLLGSHDAREIVFTSGATESNNAAVRSALKSFRSRRKIVTTRVEHSSIKNLCNALGEEGYDVITIGVERSGTLKWEEFERALTGDVAIVTVMWANNETGVLFPMERIAAIVKAKGLLLHVDATQAVGKIPVDLSGVPIDFLSLSAHKFHGPKGIGVLFIREGVPFEPFVLGGRQERDRRAGTENVAGMIGLSRALELAAATMKADSARVTSLRDRLESQLLAHSPDSFVNGGEVARLANTANLTIPGVETELLLIRLSEFDIAASGGSACLTGALEPSHVLEAMGLSRDLALNSVRFSLSRYTTEEEIAAAVDVIANLVSELRSGGRRTYDQ